VTNVYSSRQRTALGLQQPAGYWTNGFIYDQAKRLTNVTSQAGAFGYSYNAPRNYQPSTVNLPNTSYITNYYDSVARILETDLRKSDTTVLDSYAYLYNLAGQRTNVTRADASTVGYTYDKIGQLKIATGSSSTDNRGYLYDAAWNVNWATNAANSGQYTVNTLNELTNAGSLGVQYYDSNGNLTNSHSGNWTWTYDAENRLVSLLRLTGPPTLITSNLTEFFYDGIGRLRARREWQASPDTGQDSASGISPDSLDPGSSGSWQLLAEVHYIYDGWRVIQERDSNNVPTVSYTRGPDLSGSTEGAGGIGGLLARSDGYSSGNWTNHNYYFADGNGNITYLVNSSQASVAAYRYDPFGNLISSSGSLAGANAYRFSSKEIHANSGLHYYGYRFYDPGTERWVNRDPAHELGFRSLVWRKRVSPIHRASYLNSATFVRNQPINYLDGLGLAAGGSSDCQAALQNLADASQNLALAPGPLTMQAYGIALAAVALACPDDVPPLPPPSEFHCPLVIIPDPPMIPDPQQLPPPRSEPPPWWLAILEGAGILAEEYWPVALAF
jgi:RHS repeat-associated protein